MGSARLQASYQTVVVGGTATIQYGPHGESWHITRTAVSASSHVSEAMLNIYRGQVGALYGEDDSYTGSTGDTSDTMFDLVDGESLYAVWTQADEGAIVTLTISGTRSDPIGGFRAVPK